VAGDGVTGPTLPRGVHLSHALYMQDSSLEVALTLPTGRIDVRESGLHTLLYQSTVDTILQLALTCCEWVRQVILSTTLPFSDRVNMRRIRLAMLVGLNMGLSILRLCGRLDIFSLL
jgi:hypothetical protein